MNRDSLHTSAPPLYVIAWRSEVSGRCGRGTRQFERAQADALVEELNRDYPEIEHWVEPVRPTVPLPVARIGSQDLEEEET